MICFPNAKINIGLNVLRKRSDNFHDIETCLLAVPFYDVLEIKQADKFSIDVFGEKFKGKMEENLIYKVWKKLNFNYDIPPFEIKLLKNIPVGSGLGGGSSDAAFFLKEINSHFRLGMSLIQMEEFLSEIGSDCPFFVNNEMAIAYSKGDELKPFNPHLKDVFITFVIPKQRMSTANAYNKVIVKQPDTPLEKLLSLPMDKWKDFIDNAFESYVSTQLPVVGKIKSELYNAGAIFVSMSGSGSALYSFSSKELNLSSLEKQNIVRKSILSFK